MPRGLQLLTPPGGEPLTLAEAKLHVRQDSGVTTEDGLLTGLIVAARSWIEVAIGRALASQVWALNLDRFPRYSSSAVWQYNSDAIWQQRLPVTQLSGQWYPDRSSIRVPRPPLQQLRSITYTDGNTGQTLPLVGIIPAGVSATGSQTVTPASMAGITLGLSVIVDVGTAQETVTVSAVTATTFTATFAQTHSPNVPFWVLPAQSPNLLGGFPYVNVDTSTEYGRIAPAFGQIWPIVRQQLGAVQVQFTAGYGPVTTIALPTASGSQTVTPASMLGIYPGSVLTIDPGTTVQEMVVVTGTTATTFTATFANAHAAGAIVNCVPEALRTAAKLLVGHWYENREAISQNPGGAVGLAVESLISTYWHGEYE